VGLIVVQGTVNGVDVIQGFRRDGDEVCGPPTARHPMMVVTSYGFVEALLQTYGQVVAQWSNKCSIPDCTKK
jgi:hypothetical protein